MIGFIGLGLMGSRMAGRLLDAKHSLVVYNRTKAKADPLLEQGAVWAEHPAAVAQQCDIVFTMLANPQAVEDSALGENGFLSAMKEGALWVDCSTVNPSFSQKMSAEAEQRGIRHVDAPAAGSIVPAEQGQLLFLVGGDKPDVEACRRYLEVMGKAVNHVGGHGKGVSLKMVVNTLLAQAMAAFSEGMALANRSALRRTRC